MGRRIDIDLEGEIWDFNMIGFVFLQKYNFKYFEIDIEYFKIYVMFIINWFLGCLFVND